MPAMNVPMPSVSPLLFSDDVAASHDFLVDVFGFARGELSHGDDGAAVFGSATLGEHQVYIARPHPGQLEPAKNAAVLHSLVMVYVADVDAVFSHAQRAGAVIEYEPRDMPYGQREFGARDRDGNYWSFATPLPKSQ